ncbi:MAG: sugar phosphate isomerase/epimerase [Chitinophagaceae bacterium]
MRIKFFAPRWGAEHIDWETFLHAVKDAGYDGIEWFPFADNSSSSDHGAVIHLLEKFELDFGIVMAVIQHYPDVDEYLAELEKQLHYLSRLGQPLFITAQTGREYFTLTDIEKTLAVCRKDYNGVPVYQETHRNKWAYAAHITGPLLDKHPDLALALDISHWFCVSESYLHDQQDTVSKAVQHARHIHARVGHTQGPQVYDPALPEYAEALEEHVKVWDRIVAARASAGAGYLTVTPEFGPPPYMVFANRLGSPQEEQWRLNLWMKTFLEKRFSHFESPNS